MDAASPFSSPFPEDVAFVALHLDELDAHPLLDEEAALLSPRAVRTYREQFQLGRGAARAALERLGFPRGPILRGPHRQPLWPPGAVGSITHTEGLAMAAVARSDSCGGLGLDLERVVEIRDIAERIAVEEERSWLASLPDSLRSRASIRLFSAKESVFKAFFPRIGEYFGFHRAHLRWDEDRRVFVGRLLDPYRDVPGSQGFRVDCRVTGDLVLTSLVLPSRG